MKTNELKKILNYSKDNVSFYKKLLFGANISNANDDELIALFESLPVINKSIIVNNYRDFFSDELLKYNIEFLFTNEFDYIKRYDYKLSDDLQIFVEFTSGTTGVPFMMIKTLPEQVLLGRNMWKLRNKISPINPANMFYFQHNTPDEGKYPFPFERTTDEDVRLEMELDYLMKSNFSWWHMHLHDMELYYNFISSRRMKDFNRPQVLKVIENTGSFLSEKDKEAFENCFSCKLVDHYGSKECWMISYSCFHGYHHVNEGNIFLELVNKNGDVIKEPNKTGQIVITSLKQYIMPFIRYKTGDYAQYIEGGCDCNSNSMRIKLVPSDERIVGTKINGQGIFKDITCSLNTNYKLSKYHSIHVTQTDKFIFEVNIKNNREDKIIIENAFITAAKDYITDSQYKYLFTYFDDVEYDTLFSVKAMI